MESNGTGLRDHNNTQNQRYIFNCEVHFQKSLAERVLHYSVLAMFHFNIALM